MTGASRDTFPFPETEPDAPRRRRRAWPWLVAVGIVLVLAAGAVLGGEWVARDLVTKAVTQQLSARLGVPAGTKVDVDIPGSLLLQLATGTIDTATITAPDVETDGFSGDVSLTLRDVRVREGFAMSDGSATVRLDAAQLRALLSRVDGFPSDTVGLAAPDVTMSVTPSVLGVSVPLGVGLTPSADAGDLVLTPATLTLGGSAITAGDLRARLGGLADDVLHDWRVCLAERLPRGLVLTGAAVTGDRLEADFRVDGALLTDPALRERGSCS
ncbi:DUF2993 domain-containing protein [Microbacterium sp. SORGH_AS_0888]|uniref:LmeA family phospholipid-binding protein n=1 Tax=Microbacterium sp. SORGH_AS_0888 TaxID=3041791 RepID=UPI002785B610|nr:DUF2993 domain-containing protein [Microbacterium sp. SORGH_AS_0888]MDQ1127982.1 hypothetical protein [Microbacterium sp. SORGH_AS_0888]